MPSDSWATSWCLSPSTPGPQDRWARHSLSTWACWRSSPCSTASWPARPSSGSSRASCRRPPSAAPTSWPAAWRLILLFWQWQPLGGMVWEVEHPVGRALLYGGFGVGWALVLAATFVINHFDLFGLRQTWRHFRGLPQEPLHVRDSDPLPHRAAPAVCGLAVGVLEHTHDDAHAPALCGRDHGVHPRGHSARRTRPDGRASRVRRLSPTSPHAGSGVAPATHPDGRRAPRRSVAEPS